MAVIVSWEVKRGLGWWEVGSAIIVSWEEERTGVDFIVPNFARGGEGRAWDSLSAARVRGD